jgi:hypothetical protein
MDGYHRIAGIERPNRLFHYASSAGNCSLSSRPIINGLANYRSCTSHGRKELTSTGVNLHRLVVPLITMADFMNEQSLSISFCADRLEPRKFFFDSRTSTGVSIDERAPENIAAVT